MKRIKLCRNTKPGIQILLFILCISVSTAAGCSSKNDSNATVQDEKNPSNEESDQDTAQQTEAQESKTQTEDARQNQSADTNQAPLPDEDMVSKPLDLEKLNQTNQIEENGISYYNLHTTWQTPLPLKEWAKLDLISEKNTVIPAYIRFTELTRDTETIEQHMKQFMEANHITSQFQPQPLTANDEYVMLHYEILIGKETSLDPDDHISFSAVRFPLQLYSTMKSRTFGDNTEAAAERFVSDVSVFDTDIPLTSGSILKKTVICCVPQAYTAYGIMIPYMNIQGGTEYLYYKLEY